MFARIFQRCCGPHRSDAAYHLRGHAAAPVLGRRAQSMIASSRHAPVPARFTHGCTAWLYAASSAPDSSADPRSSWMLAMAKSTAVTRNAMLMTFFMMGDGGQKVCRAACGPCTGHGIACAVVVAIPHVGKTLHPGGYPGPGIVLVHIAARRWQGQYQKIDNAYQGASEGGA